MSLLKYFGERGGEGSGHPGTLSWLHGEPGPPLLNSSAPALTQSQVDSLEPQYEFKRKRFNLWIPEQLAEYVEIRNRAISGWYIVTYESRHESKEDGDEYVYLEWLQQYKVLPPSRIPTDPGERLDYPLESRG